MTAETKEINPGFSPYHDYFSDLNSDEKYTDSKSNKEYPYLKGLKRLAFTNRGGIKAIRSKVVKVPSVGLIDGGTPDCIAAVTIAIEFNDGTTFEGSADASYKAHKAPFNLHLLATAESKAEARAIRRAFNIGQCSKEEMGSEEDESEKGPINDAQIQGIKKIAKRKQLGQTAVLKLVGREDLSDIKELTALEGRMALKAITRYKPKIEKSEES